jgi:hypothetical protein
LRQRQVARLERVAVDTRGFTHFAMALAKGDPARIGADRSAGGDSAAVDRTFHQNDSAHGQGVAERRALCPSFRLQSGWSPTIPHRALLKRNRGFKSFLRDAPDGDLFAGSERYAASRVYRGLQ